MATADTSTPGGVTYDEAFDWNEYTGTADALIAAGIVERHQLPGQPGRGKASASFAPDGRAMGKGYNTEASKPGYKRIYRSGTGFRVLINVSQEEAERRRAKFEEQEKAERQKWEAQGKERESQRWRAEAAAAGMTLEQWALRNIPRSESEFRARSARLPILLGAYWRGLAEGNGYCGYSFEPAADARIQMLLDAIGKTLAGAKVIFDEAAHERAKAEALREAGLLPEQNRERPQLRLVR